MEGDVEYSQRQGVRSGEPRRDLRSVAGATRESAASAVADRTTRPRYALLVITSPDLRWEGLRAALEREPLIRLITVLPPSEALTAADRLRPDGILLAAEPGDDQLSARVQALRHVCPQAKILVFAERTGYDLEMELAQLGASGFVLWENVTAVSLHWTLGLVLEGGLRVVSPLAVDEIAFHERRVHARVEELRFTDRERAVLRGLAQGHSERSIAEDEGVGLRTVRRRVERLRERLQARDLYDLRLKARELGFGPE